MSRSLKDIYTPPQDMSSFEQWGWDKLGLHPEELWDRVFLISLSTLFASAAIIVGTVLLVKLARRKYAEQKDKEKPLRGRKVCLITIPMTETTPDESEIVVLPKGGALPVPQRDGYRFIGWFYDRQYQRPLMPFDEIGDKSVLFAKWVKEGD